MRQLSFTIQLLLIPAALSSCINPDGEHLKNVWTPYFHFCRQFLKPFGKSAATQLNADTCACAQLTWKDDALKDSWRKIPQKPYFISNPSKINPGDVPVSVVYCTYIFFSRKAENDILKNSTCNLCSKTTKICRYRFRCANSIVSGKFRIKTKTKSADSMQNTNTYYLISHHNERGKLVLQYAS